MLSALLHCNSNSVGGYVLGHIRLGPAIGAKTRFGGQYFYYIVCANAVGIILNGLLLVEIYKVKDRV